MYTSPESGVSRRLTHLSSVLFPEPEEPIIERTSWEFVVKMMCIIKDLYNGNPNLPKGCSEEKVGHNAIAGGF